MKKEMIIVKTIKDQKELFAHELAEGEKPWLVLEKLMQMDFGFMVHDLEFEMKTLSGV